MIASSYDAASYAAWADSSPRCEALPERGARELANLHIVLDHDRNPSGVVIDLTRASAAEMRSLDELGTEGLFRRVPGVALVQSDEHSGCAQRLGLTASLRVDGVATSADMDHAIELCRMLAAKPAWSTTWAQS